MKNSRPYRLLQRMTSAYARFHFKVVLFLAVPLSSFAVGNLHAQTDEEIATVLTFVINDFTSKIAYPEGACLYPNTDFRGSVSYCFKNSQPTLPASWSSQVSSITVSEEFEVRVYPQANYAGSSTLLTANTGDLGTFDNSIYSIKVIVKDVDGDGVIYTSDLCPNTPSNETANATGCSPSQLDTDNDSVNDALDLCPSSIPGDLVDSVGCSLDEDQDGVLNDLDDCTNTAPGEPVDVFGCSTTGQSGPMVNCISVSGSVRIAPSCNANEQTDTDQDMIPDNADPYPLQSFGQCAAQ